MFLIAGSDLGTSLGHMGSMRTEGATVFTGVDVEITGYPARSKSGRQMWTDKCTISDTSGSTLAPHR